VSKLQVRAKNRELVSAAGWVAGVGIARALHRRKDPVAEEGVLAEALCDEGALSQLAAGTLEAMDENARVGVLTKAVQLRQRSWAGALLRTGLRSTVGIVLVLALGAVGILAVAWLFWDRLPPLIAFKKPWDELCDSKRNGKLWPVAEGRVWLAPEGACMPATQMAAFVPVENPRGKLVVEYNGLRFDSFEVLDLSSTCEREGKGMYPLVYCVCNMGCPANTEVNYAVAVSHRFRVQPEFSPDGQFIEEGFQVLSRLYAGNLDTFVVRDEECARRMGGARGARLRRSQIAVNFSSDKVVCKAMMKCNETIAFRDGELVMKPRMICPVGHSNALLLPQSRGVDMLMHELFHGQPVSLGGHVVALHYCSGYSAQELSEVMRQMSEAEGIVIAVCGDDTLACAYGQFVENDYSMYDTTQTKQLLAAAKPMLRSWGVTAEWWALFEQLFTGPLTSEAHCPLKLELDVGAMQRSGLASTTWWNSLCNFAVGLSAVKEFERGLDFSEAFINAAQRFGFSSKCRAVDVHEATFLKGWWCPASGDVPLAWMPLPGAVCKIGKVCTNPRLVVKHIDSYQDTCTVIMHALALGYAAVPRDYPVLGALLSVYDRLGVDIDTARGRAQVSTSDEVAQLRNLVAEDFEYKPNMAVPFATVDRAQVLAMVCERYDTTAEEVTSFEQLLSSVTSACSVVEHPLVHKIAAVDYGAAIVH